MTLMHRYMPGLIPKVKNSSQVKVITSVLSQPGLTQCPKKFFKINDRPKSKHPSKTLRKLLLI